VEKSEQEQWERWIQGSQDGELTHLEDRGDENSYTDSDDERFGQ
jgi:hypothetical protein